MEYKKAFAKRKYSQFWSVWFLGYPPPPAIGLCPQPGTSPHPHWGRGGICQHLNFPLLSVWLGEPDCPRTGGSSLELGVKGPRKCSKKFERENSAKAFKLVDLQLLSPTQSWNLQKWPQRKGTPRASLPFLCPPMRRGSWEHPALWALRRDMSMCSLSCAAWTFLSICSVSKGASFSVTPASLRRVPSSEAQAGEPSPPSPQPPAGQGFCSAEQPPKF